MEAHEAYQREEMQREGEEAGKGRKGKEKRRRSERENEQVKERRRGKTLQNAFHSFERDSLCYGDLACDRKSRH